MNKELAIECIKTQRQFVDDMTREAFDMAIDLIKEAKPTADVVPVVRCKNCKCWTEWVNGTGSCSRFALDWIGTDADDFCSMGERKDDE